MRIAEPSPEQDFSPKRKQTGMEILIVGIGFLVLIPLISLHRVTDFMIFCIFALSFDLLYGYLGRLSFGRLLYLGTGAYVFGLFIKYFQSNVFLAILLGVLAAGLLGMLLGLIMVRTTGAWFSLLALAFNPTRFFLVFFPSDYIS